MRKQIKVNEQYFEVLTSRKEAAQMIQEIKDDLIWGEEDRGFYPDNSLYIEYTDGSSVYVSEGDPVKKLKKSGIAMLILEADWGTQFYNAVPQMDETYPDGPVIRIGAREDEYGKTVQLESLAEKEARSAGEEKDAQAGEDAGRTGQIIVRGIFLPKIFANERKWWNEYMQRREIGTLNGESYIRNPKIPGGSRMNKKTLKYIKNDMWEVLYNKKHLQAFLKRKLKELEAERKEVLAEYKDLPKDDWYRAYGFRTTNEAFDKRRTRLVGEVFDRWHNDQSYYLIYKDGSEAWITAEEILGGEKFPKMSDIVYAELSSADDHMDTERGELDWYSDEAMQACDYNYNVEDERKWQYETAIQFMFGTEWSIRFRQNNPDFVPVKI